jgi:hypothetical protein
MGTRPSIDEPLGDTSYSNHSTVTLKNRKKRVYILGKMFFVLVVRNSKKLKIFNRIFILLPMFVKCKSIH